MSEKNIRRAIYGKLAGDTTLNNLLASPPATQSKSIYHEQAPDNAQHPYVIFNQQAATRAYAFGGRAMDNELWLVKGVARKGDGTASADDVAGDIADRLDALLTDGTLSISGETQLYLRFENPVRYSENPEGSPRIVHAGALFRLIYT